MFTHYGDGAVDTFSNATVHTELTLVPCTETALELVNKVRATQDPAGKPGVGNMVADLLDEGSGDLDSKTFHERLDRRAIELSFSSSRDTFRGSLRN